MASKSLRILSLSILFLIVFMSAVSALDLTATDTEFSQSDENTLTISVSNVTGDVEFSFTEVKDYDDNEITFDESDYNITETDVITAIADISEDFDFFGRQYSTILTVTDDNGTATQTLTFEQTSFCKWDNGTNEDEDNDHIKLQIKDISVESGFGDDNEWLPLDEIEVKIKVENQNSDDDIDDITIEWGIFDKDSGKWVIDVDDEKDFNLKDGEDETKTINFKLDDLEEDFDELGNNLIFYARATGDDDGTDGKVCSSDYKEIDIIIEDDFVVLENIQLLETASCGDELTITADVWNIGDEDQDDVFVIIYNKELGIINQKVEIGDIDAFEDKELEVTIKIPKNIEEKKYDLMFSVFDEDGEIYENDYDDEKAQFLVPLTIQGNCKLGSDISLIASLESDAKAGEELIVRITITNNGDNTGIYSLDAIGYNDWAVLKTLEPKTIIIESGNSQEVLITFNINENVTGDKLFNVNLLSDDEIILEQPVSLTVGENSGFNLAGITGSVISEKNWYLWGIGALNVLLVAIIIIVAIRVAKKSE